MRATYRDCHAKPRVTTHSPDYSLRRTENYPIKKPFIRVAVKVLQSHEFGALVFGGKPLRSCETRRYRCVGRSTSDGRPWCEYYGATLRIQVRRYIDATEVLGMRCDECLECKGK